MYYIYFSNVRSCYPSPVFSFAGLGFKLVALDRDPLTNWIQNPSKTENISLKPEKNTKLSQETTLFMIVFIFTAFLRHQMRQGYHTYLFCFCLRIIMTFLRHFLYFKVWQ